MFGLTMFTPRRDQWALGSETFVRRADLPRQRLDRRKRLESGLHDGASEMDADRAQSAPGDGVARLLYNRASRCRTDERRGAARYIAELEPSGYNTTP